MWKLEHFSQNLDMIEHKLCVNSNTPDERYSPMWSSSLNDLGINIYLQEMSDIGRYDADSSVSSLYSASCNCFYKAKSYFESLPNPSEEVFITMGYYGRSEPYKFATCPTS